MTDDILGMCPTCPRRMGWDGHAYGPCKPVYPYGVALASKTVDGVSYALQAAAGIVTLWARDLRRDESGLSPVGLRRFAPIGDPVIDMPLTGGFHTDSKTAAAWLVENLEMLESLSSTS